MVSKLAIALITLFWVVMGALLWRSEFGSRQTLGASVPLHIVWDKILTAPDTSTLEIRQGTNRIGYCRWRADVGQEFAIGSRMSESHNPVEGMVKQLAYYRIDVDGNVAVAGFPQRMRFAFSLTLDTNRVWQELLLSVRARPDVYELSASSSRQTVRVHVNAGEETFERTVRFAELADPKKLLAELGGPALPLILGSLGAPLTTNAIAAGAAVRWQAHKKNLLLGRNAIPAYRLRATVLDRYEATFFVSPVGEILRIDLPHKIVLINDAVFLLQRPP